MLSAARAENARNNSETNKETMPFKIAFENECRRDVLLFNRFTC